MDATPPELATDDLDGLDAALEELEKVDPAEAPALAQVISDRLARVLDSTEAP